MYLFIGTYALEFWGIYLRKRGDIDIVSTELHPKFDTIILPEDIIKMIPQKLDYATPDAVYTIKCSHLGWDIKWNKHKRDVLRLKKMGCKLIPELYDELVEYWRETNGNKPQLNLYKKKTDFFNDAVIKVIDHDYLHELVAYPNKPVYTLCLKDGEDVAIDREKFKKLDPELQLRMFKEEITVIAIERWLINPKCKGKYHWIQAYDFALHKTVVSLTKGWATDFIIKNLEFYARPDYSYFKHVFDKGILMSTCIENHKEFILGILKKYDSERWNQYNAEDNDFDSVLEYFITLLPDFYDDLDFKRIETDYAVETDEGGGSYGKMIFQLNGDYYKLTYYMDSYGYNNYYETELYKVEPKEKTITIYE